MNPDELKKLIDDCIDQTRDKVDGYIVEYFDSTARNLEDDIAALKIELYEKYKQALKLES